MKHSQITIGIDGNKWFCLLGPNLHEGIAGFGDTPQDALRDLATWMDGKYRSASSTLLENGYVDTFMGSND